MSHTIWMAANYKPAVRGQDVANWRRIKLVPFEVTIPTEQQDKRLPEMLLQELPGILRWAVQGCVAWQRRGLQVPPEVEAATEAYRKEQDTLGNFINEFCFQHASVKVQSGILHQAYEKSTGEKIRGNEFARLMEDRGYRKTILDGRHYWQGIGLTSDAPEDGPRK